MMTYLHNITQRYWPIAVLIAAPLVLLAPIVFAGRVLYWGVPVLQFYPWQHLAAESYRAGQTPLWNSLVGSGAPLAANLQTGAFYPLNFLYLLLPTEYAMGYTAALHVILAGLFMYAYLRALMLSLWAALIGALAFQMCGFLIARFAFFSVTATFPWLAAWLWRAEKLVVSSQQSVISSQQSAIPQGRFAVSNQQSAVSNPTGTLRSQQSAISSQQSHRDASQSAVGSQGSGASTR